MISCLHCGRDNRDDGLFCARCGCSLGGAKRPVARLVWMDETTGKEKVYLVSEADRFAGRDPLTDIVIGDEQASAKHVKISYREAAFHVADLGSRNGTFVNGERVTDTRRLEDEDLIKIGQTMFKFSTE
ncbi:MAG: FHA domain-containing protein [bacterium]|nr:FHA domain-containing protein [bacterium]